MKRRNFLGLLTAAPAIVTSKGLFAGSCDVWTPKKMSLTEWMAIDYLEMQKELYREIMQSSMDRHKLAIMAKCHNQGVTSMLINPVKQCN